MRPRIKPLPIASSRNYTQSRIEYMESLEANHKRAALIFLIVSQRELSKKKTPLESFEEGLRRQISLFKSKTGKL
nr:MAG TPA: hypothetical protein [Crassvirales sp.]